MEQYGKRKLLDAPFLFPKVRELISRYNNTTKEIVAIKMIGELPSRQSSIMHEEANKLDLESSDDDITEIQAEIAHLSTCLSAHVTRYYGSFVRGYRLWIVMEYLAGGSCLDLV